MRENAINALLTMDKHAHAHSYAKENIIYLYTHACVCVCYVCVGKKGTKCESGLMRWVSRKMAHIKNMFSETHWMRRRSSSLLLLLLLLVSQFVQRKLLSYIYICNSMWSTWMQKRCSESAGRQSENELKDERARTEIKKNGAYSKSECVRPERERERGRRKK